MKSILLQILTLDGLGYLKLAAYQTVLVVLLDSGNDADPMHYA